MASTIPRTGFKARLAIPVLKFMDVMSRMAVPVVSEPVPAVVGTAINGLSLSSMGRPLPTGALMKSNRSASLYTVNLGFSLILHQQFSFCSTYKFAALAVSMTLPPPTLQPYIQHNGNLFGSPGVRKEVTTIVLPRPGNGVSPARFGRLGDDPVVDLEREVCLSLE